MSQESRPEKRIDLTSSFPLQPQFNLGDTYTVRPWLYGLEDARLLPTHGEDVVLTILKANEKVRHIADIFRNLSEQPQLLACMPYFPSAVTDIPSERRLELEQAAQRMGFTGLEEIYDSSLKYSRIFGANRVLDPMLDKISANRNPNWAEVLTVFRFDMMTQAYGKAVVNQINEVLEEILPAFVVDTPPVLAFNQGDGTYKAFYTGGTITYDIWRLEDILDYYIAANQFQDPQFQVTYAVNMAHEMMHYGHNNQVGWNFLGIKFGSSVAEGIARMGELAYLRYMLEHTTEETSKLFENDARERFSSIRKGRRMIRLERAESILQKEDDASRIAHLKTMLYDDELRREWIERTVTLYKRHGQLRKGLDASDSFLDELLDNTSERHRLMVKFAIDLANRLAGIREYGYGVFDVMKPLIDMIGWERLMVGDEDNRPLTFSVDLLQTGLHENPDELLTDPRELPGLKGNPLVPTYPLTEREKNRRLVGEKLPKGYM